jgi:SAM-dependent methyltransferase
MARAREHPDVTTSLSRAYSESATSYKRLWAPVIHEFSRDLLEEIPLSNARRVVDVGAGVGTLLPDLQRAAPKALVVGVDRAEGMIAESAGDIPRAVMDARSLGFSDRSFDVVVMAFVLFHLETPLVGLREAARVLDHGRVIGILTWGGGPGYAALQVWNEELEALGVDLSDEGFAHHELVDDPKKVAELLKRAGFVSIRAWTRPFEHRQSLGEFLTHRTGHGASNRRFHSLTLEDQAICLERVRSRLETLSPKDFIDRDEVVFAVARRSP